MPRVIGGRWEACCAHSPNHERTGLAGRKRAILKGCVTCGRLVERMKCVGGNFWKSVYVLSGIVESCSDGKKCHEGWMKLLWVSEALLDLFSRRVEVDWQFYSSMERAPSLSTTL